MQLEDAIERWRAAHGAGLSESTRQDIGGIITAVGSCELDDLNVIDLGEHEREAIVRTARTTTTLNATAINQFLTIIVDWAAENAPSVEIESDEHDDEVSAPASEEDFDDHELRLIDDDLQGMLGDAWQPESVGFDDEGHNAGDEVGPVDDLDALTEPNDDELVVIDDDLDDLMGVHGRVGAARLDAGRATDQLVGDAEATLVFDAEDLDGTIDDHERGADTEGDDSGDAASSFFQTIGQSTPGDAAGTTTSVFGDLTSAAPTAAVDQVSVGSGGGIFSEAAADVPKGRSIDWITAGYFAIALICFAFVIYLYFAG